MQHIFIYTYIPIRTKYHNQITIIIQSINSLAREAT